MTNEPTHEARRHRRGYHIALIFAALAVAALALSAQARLVDNAFTTALQLDRAPLGGVAPSLEWQGVALCQSYESRATPCHPSDGTVSPSASVSASLPGETAPGAGSAAAVSRSLPSRLSGWADQLGPLVGVPAVALAAYGAAQLELATADPGCGLSWPTLAGIGWVESDHGRYNGSVLGADGRSTPRIIGVPLDGSAGVARIGDSDGGRLDGDTVLDRAIGPMQFIPVTWADWATDGDADGVADPFDIDDGAHAAARYLCAAGGDLTTGSGWTAAVYAYNASASYVIEVRSAADRYAMLSQGGATG